MNKSKFLKKSLAIVLSVMMVVAMIPLSASAAATNHVFVNTNGIQTIDTSVSADTLTTVTAGTEYTVTKLYNASAAYTVDVVTQNGYTQLFTKVYDKDGEADDEYTQVTATSTVNISMDADSTKVEFFAAKADYDYDEDEGTKGAVVTITVEQPKASTSYALKSAILGSSATDASAIAGTIDNTKKTVSFTVPWGYSAAGNGVYATLENPSQTASAPTVATASLPQFNGKDYATMSVENQAGNTTNYKVYVTEEEGLAGITVGGVEAVREPSKTGGVIEKDDDGNIIYTDDYTVTLPLGTALSTTTADTVVKYTLNNGVTKAASATWGTTGTSADAAFTNGTKQILADGTKYYLTLTSKADPATTKQYTVTVNVAKSNEAEITAFTAAATISSTKYTENGSVDGDKLSVVLPKNADLSSVDVTFTTSTGATVAITGKSADSNGVWNLNLSSPVIVTVTAADGTEKVYELSATKADALQGNPTISAAKMTIGSGSSAVEYSATVDNSKYVITFAGLPYATTETAVQGATIAWAKSQGTSLGTITFESASDKDIFNGTNTVEITSDNGEKNTYTVVFTKDAAKTGKDLSSIEFTYATASDKVTADNTCKAKIDSKKKTITITLPYSFSTTAQDIVPVFTVSEGAKVYTNDMSGTKTNVGSALESGFYADDETTYTAKAPKTAIDDSNIGSTPNFTKIIVANESAVYEIDNAGSAVAISDLSAKPYKNNVVVYDVEIEYAAAEEGNTLNKFSANEGKVTSKITHDTAIEITVPASYVTNGTAFFADFEASKLATVKGASTDLIVADKTVDISTTPVAGALKVVDNTASGATEKTYDLQVYNGSSWASVSEIVVTSESGAEINKYAVTVKVAEAKTGADLTSVTVAGVKATIDTTARTVKAVLPFGTDLTDVIVAYEASELATVTTDPTGVADSDSALHYDLTGGMTFTVTAEDGRTTKKFALTVTTASQFSDVDATAYYADSVYTAAQAGIIKGYANGTFKPNNNITRRDFAIMITRMLKADTSSYTTAAFPDVKSGDYGLAAIAYCSDKGIITGRPNGKFAPDEYITRQDAAIIVARALELTSTATSTEFKDNAKIRTDAVASVAAVAAAGIIEGDTNGNFRPTDNIKRCDAAVMMVRALNK